MATRAKREIKTGLLTTIPPPEQLGEKRREKKKRDLANHSMVPPARHILSTTREIKPKTNRKSKGEREGEE